MKLNISNTTTLSHQFPPLQFHPQISLPRRPLTLSNHHRSLRPLRRPQLLRRRCQNPNFKVVRVSLSLREGELLKAEDAVLLVETCITRTLPPALTLEQGLEKIKGAVEELKSNPPCSTTGMYRFQVAVPSSAKALNWFCCQPESSGVFPQFFLSKENKSTPHKSLTLSGSRGVFGLGAAVYFKGSPSCASSERNSFKRCLSVDSTPVMAYGFLDDNFDTNSSSMKHEIGSFYFFIPQIELDECYGISTLAVTLAWNDSFLCTFEIAVQSYELSLYQASCHFWPTTDKFYNKSIRSALRKFSVVEDKNSQMVRMNPFWLVRGDLEADFSDMVSPLS